MGGGDLNSKKSWHPNTMKNQERVWKAEQAAAEEKKRIMELQHERATERDRAELNDLAKRSAGVANNDDRLHWMYDKPDKKGHTEDYLLGKTIDKNYDQPEKSDDVIPAVARRVVGSSMMTTAEDSQVDLVRKMREDPLLLVKERERAARAALLNNPLHRKRLADLLRKEQEQQKGSKVKKAKKKDKDLDSKLAAKLNALGGDKGLDVAALLASNDSSSSLESSDDDEKTKKKKSDKKSKKVKESKKNKKHSEIESSDDDKLQQKLKNKSDNSYKNSGKQRFREEDRNMKNRESKRKASEDRRYKSDYRSIKNKRLSENNDSDEDEKNKQRIYKDDCRTETRKQRSESQEIYREPKDKRNNRDAFENKQYESYWAQSSKRSISQESDRECQKKRNKRDSSAERRQDNNQKESRKHRNGSKDIKYNDFKEEKKQRNVRQDYGMEAKTKRSRKDSSDYKEKQKSLSQDSNEYLNNRRNEREMYSGNKKQTYEQLSRKRCDSSRDASEIKKVEKNRGCADEQHGRMKAGLSAEEKAARLAEMVAAGAEREQQRGRRVAEQREADARADAAPRRPRAPAPALPDSLESRLHSNRHYIQRSHSHMNEHFARR